MLKRPEDTSPKWKAKAWGLALRPKAKAKA